jgi:tetratricopeptide (TPR) repeat protein
MGMFFRIAATVVAVSSMAFAAAAQPDQKSAGALSRAQSSIAEGNPQNAIDILTRYIEQNPSNISARLLLGQAYEVAGQSDQAVAQLQAVLQASPENLRALTLLAEVYQRQGSLEDADQMLARAVKASNGDSRLRMQSAVVLARLHRFQEAQARVRGLATPQAASERIAFHRLRASIAAGLGDSRSTASEMEKALAVKPSDDSLRLATATAQAQASNWRRVADLASPLFSGFRNSQAGLLLLQAQLALHREFHPTLQKLRATGLPAGDELQLYQSLSEILISSGEMASAIEVLEHALELDGTRADLAYNLALAQYKAGRLDEASRSAERGRAIRDSAELEDLLGDIQEARGDNLASARAYQAAVALAPGEEKYRLALAVEFMRHSNFDAARLVLTQAAELWPDSWRVQLALGMVEHFAGTDEQAGRILLHAAELAPQPEIALSYLGEIQVEQAAAPSEKAVSELCSYADKNPHHGKMQYYCGAALFRRDYTAGKKNDTEEIVHRLRTATTLLPSDAAAQCQLGRAFRWLERWQDAQGAFEQCVRLNPNSDDGHYRLAQIYQRQGDRQRSEQQMELYRAASQRIADENARRDQTMKTFLLTIRNSAGDTR